MRLTAAGVGGYFYTASNGGFIPDFCTTIFDGMEKVDNKHFSQSIVVSTFSSEHHFRFHYHFRFHFHFHFRFHFHFHFLFWRGSRLRPALAQWRSR